MTIIYSDDNNKLTREETNEIDFKEMGIVEFNNKEINTEDLIRIEE